MAAEDKHLYQPQIIENQAQEKWEKQKQYQVTEDPKKPKFYCLSMFPYPSGKLHMGHVRNYTIGDVISRYQRLQQKNVLQPIGWDAFGLPAENAAIANKTAPAKWTYKNITQMKKQCLQFGLSVDWTREFATCTPEYYRWEQWLFTKMFDKGLVYKKMATVNWDPVDQTVLANEQVVDGKGWRSGATVIQKKIPQWFIRITDYAEELLTELDNLEGWPKTVKEMQRNWIGRSEGAEVEFPVATTKYKLKVYTTRPDTLFGVTYLAIAADHDLAKQAAINNPEIQNFINKCNQTKLTEAQLSTATKEGIATGFTATHPLTQEELPIWIANFVLSTYGTGAVMAVPAHDERDYHFAKTYDLPITAVIKPKTQELDISTEAYTQAGILFNSKEFDGLDNQAAKTKIIDHLVANKIGSKKINYRLRDWSVSRQRYWGTPIPMATDATGNSIPVPAAQLPVTLPEDVILDGNNHPLKDDPEYQKITINGQELTKETDTFDTFVESSWYYARYTCPKFEEAILDKTAANYWLPVDQYIGGIEHACMHLLYARLFHKILRDEGLVNSNEPFNRLLCQGMVLADSFFYYDNNNKQIWVNPSEVTLTKDENGKILQAVDKEGNELTHNGMIKMSKSKNNGVDPETMINKYGADTIRLFTMFAAPADMDLEWQEAGVEGSKRFVNKIWKLANSITIDKQQPLDTTKLNDKQTNILKELHKTIKKVTDDIDRRQTFNTAIAAIMELTGKLTKLDPTEKHNNTVLILALNAIILMLYPITPHLCDYIWTNILQNGDIEKAKWPEIDPKMLVETTADIVVQVNGKLRAKIQVEVGASKDYVTDIAKQENNVKKFLQEKNIKKIIYIPNKILNIVI